MKHKTNVKPAQAIHDVVDGHFNNPGRMDTATLHAAQNAANRKVVPIKVKQPTHTGHN
ncbi:MAG: hypothetical protein PHG25_04095 [Candidatus Pacebacteria bacterium]|nr:hypothetical protein [Candidatus Paceibacterota bacterium]